MTECTQVRFPFEAHFSRQVVGRFDFRHLRRYLSRFPGCVDAAHSEHVLGCFLLAAERMHA